MDGQPTHQVAYDVRRHVRVYLGLNGIPLDRKEDDPGLVYGVDHVVCGTGGTADALWTEEEEGEI